MLDDFADAYIDCALWSSCDENDCPLDDNFDERDIDPATMRDMRDQCREFYRSVEELIKDDAEQAGHDFWLTRNGHGAGFWDGDWQVSSSSMSDDAVGEFLTRLAKEQGTYDLYVGDDNKIHGS